MHKTQLIQQIAKQANLTEQQARAALDAVTDTIQTTLQQGGKVTLIGFGSFEVRYLKASDKYVRPGTKIPLPRPAMKIPGFKAGKSFKNALK